MDAPNVPWLGLSDPIAALTHLLAAAFAAGAVARLWRRSAGNLARRVSVLVFGASMFLLFLASGSYHAVFEPLKSSLRRVDHAAIYVLIAGTFTPVVAHATTGPRRKWVLVVIWVLASGGVVLKLAFFGVLPESVDTILYLAMGWLGVVPAYPIVRARLFGLAFWLALGAIAYTLGALCELFRWPVIVPGVFGYHEVFHIAVVAGSAAFLALVLRHVVPKRLARESASTEDGSSSPKRSQSNGIFGITERPRHSSSQ